MSSAGGSTWRNTVRRPRVYLDTDVLLAAAGSISGASHLIIKLSELTLIEGVISHAKLPHLVAACLAGCHYLVTHNIRHYAPKPGIIEVLNPRAFLERIRLQLSRLAP